MMDAWKGKIAALVNHMMLNVFEDLIENEFFVQSWTDELWFSPFVIQATPSALPLNIVTKEIGEPCCHDENLSKKTFRSSNYSYFQINVP